MAKTRGENSLGTREPVSRGAAILQARAKLFPRNLSPAVLQNSQAPCPEKTQPAPVARVQAIDAAGDFIGRRGSGCSSCPLHELVDDGRAIPDRRLTDEQGLRIGAEPERRRDVGRLGFRRVGGGFPEGGVAAILDSLYYGLLNEW